MRQLKLDGREVDNSYFKNLPETGLNIITFSPLFYFSTIPKIKFQKYLQFLSENCSNIVQYRTLAKHTKDAQSF